MSSRNCKTRNLSWRICNSRRVNSLKDPWAILAYTWMIPSADNAGRLEGDATILAGMLFPRQREEITTERMIEILQCLHDAGLLYWYVKGSDRFIQFPETSWGKYQKMVGNMKNKSNFPSPDQDNYSEWYNMTRENSLEREKEGKPQISDNKVITYSRESKVAEDPRKKKKQGDNTKSDKTQYAEFVSMTATEHESLLSRLGKNGAARCIEILDNYKGANGKKYTSDYRAILNWVITRYEQEDNQKGLGKKDDECENAIRRLTTCL